MRRPAGAGWRAWGAVLAGAALFGWPALVNGYPIVFSDTGGFLEQALLPDEGWDKPWVYGPFLTPFHWKLTLWPAMWGQCLILSAMLWMTQASLRAPSPARHVVACAALAAFSAAPWFTSLLMPDFFAPVTVLAAFVLAERGWTGGWGRAWVGLVGVVAIASHLAHLVVAAACAAVLGVSRLPWGWRAGVLSGWRAGAPLVAALALVMAANWVGLHRLGVSPYGSVFALARLVGDGPGRDYIESVCPRAGLRVCGWAGRLPEDSDAFLWSPEGPVWADGYGPLLFAPEAQALVRQTVLARPGAVAVAALRNTGRQLLRVEVGDALIPTHLAATVTPRLKAFFPAAEVARFERSMQAAGALPGVAAPWRVVHAAALLVGAAGSVALAVAGWRRAPGVARLAMVVLVGVVANAFATGALSGPHDRYGARIAWLVLVPVLLYAGPGSGRAASAASRSRMKLRRLNGSMPT